MTIALAAAQAPHKLPVGKMPSYLHRPQRPAKVSVSIAVFIIALIAANFVGSKTWGEGDTVGIENRRAQELSYAYVGNFFVNIQDVFSSAEFTGRLLASAGSRSNLDNGISSAAAKRFESRVAGEFIEKDRPSSAFGFFSAAISGQNPGKIFVNGFRGSIDNTALNGSLFFKIFHPVTGAAGE